MDSKQRVLVAEDDRDNRELLAECLRERFSVTVAADGAQALEVVGRGFDLLIVDLEMPRLDGLGFIQAIRHRHIEVPVLLISGAFEGPERARQLAVEYVQKPFDMRSLNDKIGHLIE